MSIDSGLYTGNYFDYENDDLALRHERDIVQELNDEGQDRWTDIFFPTSSHSLYLNPYNPPAGYIAGDKLRWCRISSKIDIQSCRNPKYSEYDAKSSWIVPGVLRNQYFINALRLLACKPQYLRSLLVSDKYAHRGIYTFKIFKAGKWRYVFIDDFIACHTSGKVYFCRNYNPNETFAMLLEKAYAKLHGCYEAISCGMINKAIEELTYGSYAGCKRIDHISLRTVCDEVWDIVEKYIKEDRLIGCGRFISDSFSESPSIRQGITLACIYQIVDICICTAKPTIDLDGVTVGMICVKNMQGNAGRFIGAWSYGHAYWAMYPEIAHSLYQRTIDIQYRRGLGPHLDEVKKMDFSHHAAMIKETRALSNNDIDDLSFAAMSNGQPTRVVQPLAEDLHWIQIEDFVDVFNRLYYVFDESSNPKFKSCRYQSAWAPENSGPLFIDQSLTDDSIIQANHVKAQLTKLARKPFLVGPKVVAPSARKSDQGVYSFRGGIESDSKRDSIEYSDQLEGELSREGRTNSSFDRHGSVESADGVSTRRSSLKYQRADDFLDSVALQEGNKSIAPSVRSSMQGSVEGSTVSSIRREHISINPSFHKNPSFIVNISEFTALCIHVYQLDHRWSLQRPFQTHINMNDDRMLSYRDKILLAAMKYDYALGFVIKKLPQSDLNQEIKSEFHIISNSSQLEFSGSVSAAIDLSAGRYAVIPFTHLPVSNSKDFMIHFNYIEGYADMEGPQPSENDVDVDIEDLDACMNAFPRIDTVEEWEYFEKNDESSTKSLYEEMSSISQSIVNINKEMSEMRAKLQQYQDQGNAGKSMSSPSNETRKTERFMISPRFKSPKNRNREAAFIASKLNM